MSLRRAHRRRGASSGSGPRAKILCLPRVTFVTTQVLSLGIAQRLRALLALTKPRVVSLIVFTAVIGMFLATPGMVPLQALIAGTLGIALTAGAAAAFNCLVEQKIDAVMA